MADVEEEPATFRQRDRVDPEKLAAGMRPSVAKGGKSFLKYNETMPMTKSKLEKTKILNNKVLVTNVKIALQEDSDTLPNFSLALFDVRAACQILVRENMEAWKFNQEMADSWVDVMTKRMRNLTHGISKGIHNKAKWAMDLIQNAVKIDDDSEVEDNTLPPASPPVEIDVVEDVEEYTYGWMKELSLGYRSKSGSHEKELSMSPEITDDMDDGDGLDVTFLDGSVATIDKDLITVGDFRAILNGRANPNLGQPPLFEMEHIVTHNTITLRQRTDTCLLLSIYEQSKQILQVRADKFGPLPNDDHKIIPNGHTTIQAALAFMRPLVISYCQNDLKDKEGLKEARDNKLKEMNLDKPMRKRPAAAPAKAADTAASDLPAEGKKKKTSGKSDTPKKATLLPAAVTPSPDASHVEATRNMITLRTQRSTETSSLMDDLYSS